MSRLATVAEAWRARRHWMIWLLGPTSLGGLMLAGLLGSWPLAAAALVGLVCTARRWAYYRRRWMQRTPAAFKENTHAAAARENIDAGSLVEQLLRQQRYALLLRSEIAPNLDAEELELTVEALDAHMALVPAGQVVVGVADDALEEGQVDAEIIRAHHARLYEIAPAFLDRRLVTNEEYQHFVSAGGYHDLAIWDPEVLGGVLDFVDQTGRPGPRFWRDGTFPPGAARLPVVGVSWYEAAAYARWVGKRLPSDAEWVKAGCWPISPRAGVWIQRRYPWGAEFDSRRANLWSAGVGGPASVDAFEEGISAGGVHQLIGNVWEWTVDNFGRADDVSLALPTPMKSIRGGAFDTYFENQASCNFQSGECPLNRKPNIGFRLALSAADVTPLAEPCAAPAAEEEVEAVA